MTSPLLRVFSRRLKPDDIEAFGLWATHSTDLPGAGSEFADGPSYCEFVSSGRANSRGFKEYAAIGWLITEMPYTEGCFNEITRAVALGQTCPGWEEHVRGTDYDFLLAPSMQPKPRPDYLPFEVHNTTKVDPDLAMKHVRDMSKGGLL